MHRFICTCLHTHIHTHTQTHRPSQLKKAAGTVSPAASVLHFTQLVHGSTGIPMVCTTLDIPVKKIL